MSSTRVRGRQSRGAIRRCLGAPAGCGPGAPAGGLAVRGLGARAALALLLVAAMPAGGRAQATAPTYLVPGLIVDEGDRSSIPEPASNSVSGYYDFIDKTFFYSAKRVFDFPRHFRALAGRPKQALNINAFDEAPNSTWFTNRIFFDPPAAEEVSLGSNRGTGPAASGAHEVIRGKTQGVTPGFRIRDATGQVYVIKFDPPANWEMATGAELISTRIFHLAGYNAPENDLFYLDPGRITVSGEAKFVDPKGVKRPMTRDDVMKMLEPLPREPDGTIRAVASKFLAGKVKGHYHYIGRRQDDYNDLVRHEHRRELRGLRVVAAWTNHNDIRNLNNLDVYVTDPDGRSYMKHYLIDFGATLGSASRFPNLVYEGHEYILDWSVWGKSAVSLGAFRRPWEGVEPPDRPAIGYFESELFRPHRWKPNYPNPAFSNMTDRDGYWGAKIVMSFTDEIIRLVVAGARYTDPADTELMERLLRERRDKIGRHWFGKINPLDRFRLVEPPALATTRPGGSAAGGAALEFDDLAIAGGLEPEHGSTYRYRFTMRTADGGESRGGWTETDGLGAAAPRGSGTASRAAPAAPAARWIPLPAVAGGSRRPVEIEVELRTRRPERKGWSRATVVELVDDGELRLVGIRR